MLQTTFAEPIQRWITVVGAPQLTEVFIITMLAVFVLAIFSKLINRLHAFTQYAPTLLTSLGILGTFFGIVAGLLQFDIDHIDCSIDMLLSGMKTAFTTSLVGILLSIIFKLLVSTEVLSFWRTNELDEDHIGIGELYTVMQEQRDGVIELQSAIGGDNESSLTGQRKLLRFDSNDNHRHLTRNLEQRQEAFETFQDRLWLKLLEFSEMLSKSATEQVINGLQEVIRDFNNNLTEQFGERI
jgi:hypothetical protein